MIAYGLDMLEMSTVRYRIIDMTGKEAVIRQVFVEGKGWFPSPAGIQIISRDKLQIQEEK